MASPGTDILRASLQSTGSERLMIGGELSMTRILSNETSSTPLLSSKLGYIYRSYAGRKNEVYKRPTMLGDLRFNN